MGLRQTAEADLGAILEDSATGFGWPITVTNPDGLTAEMTGFSNDISQVIDPDTGQIVSGRVATVALRVSSLVAAGLAVPENVTDPKVKPWIVAFDDINGNGLTFKVKFSDPDRALGLVICTLEFYKS